MEFDLLAAARDLIAADSVSAHGNLKAVEVLEGIAHRFGLETFRQEAHALGTAHANLIVHHKGAKPRDGSLLLVTHTDTVGSGPLDLWTETNPWRLKQDGDTLYGLGVADVKLDSLAKLQAMALAPAETHGKVAFCGTFAEEVGCLGAKHFLANRPFNPAWVSCGEPSELRIIDAHKGYLVAHVHLRPAAARPGAERRLRLTFHGKAAHSSTPLHGVNAIEKAFAFCAEHGVWPERASGGDLANKIPARCVIELGFDEKLRQAAQQAGIEHELVEGAARSGAAGIEIGRHIAAALAADVLHRQPLRDERFDPATAVCNHNVIQTADDGSVEITCDARLLPGHDPADIFDRLDAFARRLGEQGGVQVEIERGRSNPAMALPPASRLRDAAMEASRNLGFDPTPMAKPTNTEGGVFVTAGLEAIVFGPGRSTGNAHTANERQSVAQIRDATRWYGELIRNLCG
ncbi:M20/M25/M40 family metallo-hydrolase [Vulgatibacter sp.]|uniref:M20/M25/M40 family metallo-hydrolase n=1 Tax=Vulgatibacter sp. TaxID=1971226 RepID=UPI0035612F54